MELKTYLEILQRRKWVILITALVAAIIAGLGTQALTPKYKASATLRIVTSAHDTINYGNILYAERLMHTYAEVAASRPVLETAMQSLNLEKPPQISVEILGQTELLEITVEYEDPVLATETANFLAEFLTGQSKRFRDFRNNPAHIVALAPVPTTSSTPGLALMIPLGLISGLAGGLGLAFLFENLDSTLYTTQQIELATEQIALGMIPKKGQQKQIAIMNGSSPEGEAFRRLRTNIFAYEQNEPLKTILVTSANPGEGKSTITVNLAYSIAQSGRKVIVVDSDFRRPTIHTVFGLSNEIGLSSVLKQEVTLTEAVQRCNASEIWALNSGPLPSNPAELLNSPQMLTLIEQMAAQYDIVLVDTPALIAVVDALVLAPRVDGVLLVIGRTQVQKETVQDALQQLAIVKAKLIGVVMNRMKRNRNYYYYAQKAR